MSLMVGSGRIGSDPSIMVCLDFGGISGMIGVSDIVRCGIFLININRIPSKRGRLLGLI